MLSFLSSKVALAIRWVEVNFHILIEFQQEMFPGWKQCEVEIGCNQTLF